MSQPPTSDTQAWTIARLLSWTRDYFARQEVEDPRLSAEVLLAHALNLQRIELYTRFETIPDAAATDGFRKLVLRAAAHEPVAYIVGRKEFFSLTFEVTPDVLIPRPETELIVECVLEYCRTLGTGKEPASLRSRLGEEDAPHILDIGTGCGCIPIAILKHLPGARATGTDISGAALMVASRNAERHAVGDRLTLLEADRLDMPPGATPAGGFDILTSNPPYVSSDEMDNLARHIREHEPRIALTDDAEGLSFFRSIAEDGPRLLAPGGTVVVEVGAGQSQAVVDILTAGGQFRHVGTQRDRVGGHERVVWFVRKRPSRGL